MENLGFKIAVTIANVSQSSQNSHILLPLELIVHTNMYVGTQSDRKVDIISECPLSLAICRSEFQHTYRYAQSMRMERDADAPAAP